MKAIYIPQLLKATEKTETIAIGEFIAGLDTLTPVRGKMRVTHRGNYLEVSVKVETIITLTCDRCLRQYNHRLLVDTSEFIWLNRDANQLQTLPQEREIAWEDLSESLPADGYFEPNTWLYEQLSLAMPLRQLCSQDCQLLVDESSEREAKIDSRWATLEALKKQLP